MDGLLVNIITAAAPILIALIGIIPTILANGKKTRESVEEITSATTEQIQKLQNTLDSHIKEDEDDNARNRRYRILRFYDELCLGQRHSESHFEDILDDIDAYERYCDEHPEYHNNRGHLAMQQIKTTYTRLRSEGRFLVHEERGDEHAAE